jgi:hypothetical protein
VRTEVADGFPFPFVGQGGKYRVYRLYPVVTPVDSFIRIPRLRTLPVGVNCTIAVTVPFPLLCHYFVFAISITSRFSIPQSPYHVFLGVDV